MLRENISKQIQVYAKASVCVGGADEHDVSIGQ